MGKGNKRQKDDKANMKPKTKVEDKPGTELTGFAALSQLK
jgi:hypothetical protein